MAEDIRPDDGAGVPGGGGTGHSGGVEGVDAFAPTPWDETCDGAGSGGPESVDGTDSENWAQ